MASFGKVDRYVSPTLWTQSLVRLLRQLAGDQLTPAPLWRQLAEALRLLILDGRLTLQTRLPGERELAAALERQPDHHRQRPRPVAGGEGFLYSRQGAGHALFCRNARGSSSACRHLIYA